MPIIDYFTYKIIGITSKIPEVLTSLEYAEIELF